VGGNDGAVLKLHVGEETLVTADEAAGIKGVGQKHDRIFITFSDRTTIKNRFSRGDTEFAVEKSNRTRIKSD
jgi:hypothetical protein